MTTATPTIIQHGEPPSPADVPASQPSERRLVSKAQVAARLGCSERSLERLVKQGRFPAPRRYGRAVVWFESAVEHVLGLAEQEQLQWRPVATDAIEVRVSKAVLDAEPSMPSPIPEAHELQREGVDELARKRRKTTSTPKRRAPKPLTADDLEALGHALGHLER